MNFPADVPLSLYRAALQLYPRAFRDKYAAQMLDAARQCYAESAHPMRLTAALAWDTLASLFREHWRAATPASPVYTAAFALFFSAILLTLSVARQQDLRRKADQRPLSVVARIASGADPAPFLAGPSREIATDTWLNRPGFFVALYDEKGQPIAGNATLHGVLPRPPGGIFRNARAHGLNKVSWQPEPGIRVATVVKPLPNGGFILAGQSLIVGEAKDSRFNSLLTWIWLTMLTATVGIGILTHLRRPSTA
jgi:hypothetical protein